MIERWRTHCGAHKRGGIDAVGEFEALFALAGNSFEHPANPFPELTDAEGGYFDATALCHPLLPQSQRVANDVKLGGELRLLIVSGSNMSGKNTLLISLGMYPVLASPPPPLFPRPLSPSPP